MKHILMIIGSMRKKSFNRQLAQKAAVMLDGKAEVSFLDYSDLPYMDQDIEFPAPDAVSRVREQVMQADGIWIFTPEYNFSYPGVLKNLLDWLSRPLKPGTPRNQNAIAGKKVTVSGAGGQSAAGGARTKLRELLKFIFAEQMEGEETGIALDMQAFQTNTLTLSPENEAALARQAGTFLDYLS